MSIFQGADFNISHAGQRQEEEEFLEDQHKRQAELHHLFSNAFKDLGDDESSINSTDCSVSNHIESDKSDASDIEQSHLQRSDYHESFYNGQNNHANDVPLHQLRPQPAVDKDVEDYVQSDYNKVNELHVLYDVRLREIESLKKELTAEKSAKEQILNKLIITEREKNGILATLNQNKDLLISSKEEIQGLQEQIELLKNEIIKVEKSRDGYKNDLGIAKLQIQNLEQNIAMMERCDVRVNREKQIDQVIDSLNKKHNKEINLLQSELDKALDKLQEKDNVAKKLEEEIQQLEKRHMNNVFKTCDTSVRQEAAVKALLDEANNEKIELIRKYKNLQDDYKQLQDDISQFQRVRSFNLLETSSDDKDTDSIIMMGIGRKGDRNKKNKSLSDTDTVAKLKEELQRALLGQTSKRKHIQTLKQQIQSMEIQINNMREQEKIYLTQTDNLKKDMSIIMDKLTKSDAGELTLRHSEEISKYVEEISKLEGEKEILENKVKKLEDDVNILQRNILENEMSKKRQGDEYMRFHDREVSKLKAQFEEEMNDKEKTWKNEIEKLLNECDEVKQLYLEIREKKDKISKLYNEEKALNGNLLNEKEQLQNEIESLKIDIGQLEDHILKLSDDTRKSDQSKMDHLANTSIFNYFRQEFEKLKESPIHHDLTDDDVALIKEKYSQLETRLRKSFEESMREIKEENLKLTFALKEKEEALLKLRKQSFKLSEMDSDSLNSKTLEEINRLEKEIEKLKSIEVDKNNEILNIKSSFQKKLQDEIEELETNLTSKHAQDLAQTEERVKSHSLKYFTEEIEKIRSNHKDEILNIKNEENKKYEEIKKIMDQKNEEIIMLKKEIDHCKKVINETKMQASLMMKHWAEEVNVIIDKRDSVIKESEELREKLKSARKTALSYKKKMEDIKSNYTEKHNKQIHQLKEKFSVAVTSKEDEIMRKLQEIEDEYRMKEELLRQKI